MENKNEAKPSPMRVEIKINRSKLILNNVKAALSLSRSRAPNEKSDCKFYPNFYINPLQHYLEQYEGANVGKKRMDGSGYPKQIRKTGGLEGRMEPVAGYVENLPLRISGKC